jgi:hypothetical protein
MNRFRIIEIVDIAGLSDRLAVLETITGSLKHVTGRLTSPQLAGEWQLGSFANGVPPESLRSRDTVGIAGPPGLVPGMELTSP